MKRFLIFSIVVAMLVCTACFRSKKKASEGTTEQPSLIDQPVTETTLKTNPYYTYPINGMTPKEISDEIIRASLMVVEGESLDGFKKLLPVKVGSTTRESGLVLRFINDYDYSYSDANFIDNIEYMEVNAQEIGGKFSYNPSSNLKIYCMFEDNARAEEVYGYLAVYLETKYDIESDSRHESSWTMFAWGSNRNSVFTPLSKYQDRNTGFTVLEVMMPLETSTI